MGRPFELPEEIRGLSGWKRIYAEDVAAAECFEWNYEEASDWDLYEAIESMGYTWNEEQTTWVFEG